MSIFDVFKKDPDVIAAERRAYEEESKRVKQEKKNEAMREAVRRGKAKAHGGSGIGATAAKVGKKIIAIGEYGASLNWEGEAQLSQARTRKGKGRKSKRQPASFGSMYEMPEFPF